MGEVLKAPLIWRWPRQRELRFLHMSVPHGGRQVVLMVFLLASGLNSKPRRVCGISAKGRCRCRSSPFEGWAIPCQYHVLRKGHRLRDFSTGNLQAVTYQRCQDVKRHLFRTRFTTNEICRLSPVDVAGATAVVLLGLGSNNFDKVISETEVARDDLLFALSMCTRCRSEAARQSEVDLLQLKLYGAGRVVSACRRWGCLLHLFRKPRHAGP